MDKPAAPVTPSAKERIVTSARAATAETADPTLRELFAAIGDEFDRQLDYDKARAAAVVPGAPAAVTGNTGTPETTK